MPREDRRIVFSFEEVYKALYGLCAQQEVKKPPPGVITAVEQVTDDQNRLFVTIANPQTSAEDRLEYGRDFLAAALMLFCRGSNIPLPKTSKKAVELYNDHVVLRVKI